MLRVKSVSAVVTKKHSVNSKSEQIPCNYVCVLHFIGVHMKAVVRRSCRLKKPKGYCHEHSIWSECLAPTAKFSSLVLH